MMINCPNCNLLQPKDQYCAQCGINMVSWKPPQQPTWKKLVSNWMFQLGVLFALVCALVLKDSLSGQSKPIERASVPVVKSIPRDRSQSVETAQTQATESQLSVQASESHQEVDATPEPIEETAANNQKTRARSSLQKIASVKVSVMGREMIDALAVKSQKVDESSFLISKKDFTAVLSKNRRERKIVGEDRQNFKFDKGFSLFVGEEDLETGLKLGFFTSLSISTSPEDAKLRYELSYRNRLKLDNEPPAQMRLSVQSPPDYYLVIIDSSPHDLSFSQEERDLFAASDRFEELNDEAFREGLRDIVLVLEVK